MAKTKSKTKTLELIKNAVKARASKKVTKSKVDEVAVVETVGIPGLIQPTEYDLNDELSLLDGFNARSFSE